MQEFPELEREKKKVGGREGWEATRGSTHTHIHTEQRERERDRAQALYSVHPLTLLWLRKLFEKGGPEKKRL